MKWNTSFHAIFGKNILKNEQAYVIDFESSSNSSNKNATMVDFGRPRSCFEWVCRRNAMLA
jgi:hypothetical protein